MLPLILLLVLTYIGIGGLARVIAPSRFLQAGKKTASAKNPEATVTATPEADRKGRQRIWIAGALRVIAAAMLIWMLGVEIGRSPSLRPRAGADELEQLVFGKGADLFGAGKEWGW